MPEASNARILTKRVGAPQPLIPRLPLLSSAESAGWRGILLEKHLADADYAVENFDVHSHLVHIFAGVPVRHEWLADGRHTTALSTEGSVLVEPRACMQRFTLCDRNRTFSGFSNSITPLSRNVCRSVLTGDR